MFEVARQDLTKIVVCVLHVCDEKLAKKIFDNLI